ncbi:MAG: hypothetical protein V1816_10855 [Pseudomonadota bacterium]
MVDKPLFKSKTFWAGAAGIIAALGGFLTGSLPLEAALQTGLTALLGIFFRDALRNSDDS